MQGIFDICMGEKLSLSLLYKKYYNLARWLSAQNMRLPISIIMALIPSSIILLTTFQHGALSYSLMFLGLDPPTSFMLSSVYLWVLHNYPFIVLLVSLFIHFQSSWLLNFFKCQKMVVTLGSLIVKSFGLDCSCLIFPLEPHFLIHKYMTPNSLTCEPSLYLI